MLYIMLSHVRQLVSLLLQVHLQSVFQLLKGSSLSKPVFLISGFSTLHVCVWRMNLLNSLTAGTDWWTQTFLRLSDILKW